MDNISIGFELIVLGMPTVFFILLVLIYLGKLLTLLVNKWAPEEIIEHRQAVQATRQETIDQHTLSLLTEAVNVITAGKGTISNVKKV